MPGPPTSAVLPVDAVGARHAPLLIKPAMMQSRVGLAS